MILSNTNKYLYIKSLSNFNKLFNKLDTVKQKDKYLALLSVKHKIRANRRLFLYKNNTFHHLNQNVIRYVINVISFPSNTVVNVTDVRGKVLVSVSEGLIGISKETKQSKSTQMVKIFKTLLVKAGFLKGTAVAVNFKNVKRYQESFVINLLKTKVFIKSIQSFTLIPHNGCRPKKIKKLKLRTKRLVLR